MPDNLTLLRAAGVAHPTYKFSDDDVQKIDGLTPEEVVCLITAREKLGPALITIRDDDDQVHPDTFPI